MKHKTTLIEIYDFRLINGMRTMELYLRSEVNDIVRLEVEMPRLAFRSGNLTEKGAKAIAKAAAELLKRRRFELDKEKATKWLRSQI